ncbi:dienelactone hydrolase family protein [Streptomyces pristinaespiralis]|uniref:dienelactone hydrolase family protein n=1 Tax=Streptomyces pristinaespiralis TaxID=38300 RepID=UPI0033C6C6E7
MALFEHGSSSSRHRPRSKAVATTLEQAGRVAMLMDLVTRDKDAVAAQHRFDVVLLGQRLVVAIDWLGDHPDTAAMPLGLFGASSGAAATLVVAAERPVRVQSVVARGGRPDLAGEALTQAQVPVLLIVGRDDTEVLRLHRVHLMPGVTHLFEEPGALADVAKVAGGWFLRPGGEEVEEWWR